ncbi:MAG: hypothetical protein M1820_009725 [Bogoriella megaspora]|nr:MAG: hypothetical protein M1820_009725 [Bogoriella megaspora]
MRRAWTGRHVQSKSAATTLSGFAAHPWMRRLGLLDALQRQNVIQRQNLVLRGFVLRDKRFFSTARDLSSAQVKGSSVALNMAGYEQWSHEQLVERIEELERRLKEATQSYSTDAAPPPVPSSPSRSPLRPPKKHRQARTIDPSRYNTRFIALKFAYLGQEFNGFEHHANNKTPKPTIEEELWKALTKTKLILPIPQQGREHNGLSQNEEVNWEGCEYSKCGRTDKGVSAFGQVVGLRVRSSKPLEERPSSPSEPVANPPLDAAQSHQLSLDERKNTTTIESTSPTRPREAVGTSNDSTTASPSTTTANIATTTAPPWHPIHSELPYIQLLNRLLPATIRILAWCPSPPPSFSARFSCRERRYRYFFTQPAFAPNPRSQGSPKGGDKAWLDISAMRDAASRYVGVHDWRNFCKNDASKQITNYERRVFRAEIREVDLRKEPVGFVGRLGAEDLEMGEEEAVGGDERGKGVRVPRVYSFDVDGSAFLWHQVRHMVAVLFLVGQGLERPEVVSELLDVGKCPTKPVYDMASDRPLVLWDCIFPAEGNGVDGGDGRNVDGLEWVYAGDSGLEKGSKVKGDLKWGRGGVVDDLWGVWREKKMDEVLAGLLIDVVAGQGKEKNRDEMDTTMVAKPSNTRVFEGSHLPRNVGTYIPLLERRRNEHFEVVNARYAAKKGLDQSKVAEANDDANV